MDKEILQLEKDLFKYEKISNIKWLDNIIDDDYIECGKSGLLYNKEITIKDLSKCTSDRDITIYNFTCKKIDNNTYLAHYITKNNNKYYYRSSIWKNNNGLKIIFHQATKLDNKVISNLIKE